jgi:hypothetical protein
MNFTEKFLQADVDERIKRRDQEIDKLRTYLTQVIDDKTELREQRDRAEARTSQYAAMVNKLYAELEEAHLLINQRRAEALCE